MKMNENEWKWMKMNENEWKWMKTYEMQVSSLENKIQSVEYSSVSGPWPNTPTIAVSLPLDHS